MGLPQSFRLAMIAFIDEVPVGEKNIPIDRQGSNIKNPIRLAAWGFRVG